MAGFQGFKGSKGLDFSYYSSYYNKDRIGVLGFKGSKGYIIGVILGYLGFRV